MPAKIRLQRHGRKQRPFYHIVIADARAPRDGKFIEKIGVYNPMTSPATIELDRDKAFQWLMVGAQPTNTARAILRFKGVYYKKHLQRGVAKGSLSQEDADSKYQNWIAEKDAKIAARFAESAQKKADKLVELSGKPKARKQIVQEEVKKAAATDGGKKDDSNKSFADSVEQTTVESVAADAGNTPVAPPAPVVEKPAAEEKPAVVEAPKETPAPVEEVKAVEEKPVEKPAEEVKVVEEVKVAPVVADAPKAEDDYKKIEGIGPKIAELLHKAGLASFSDLASADVDKLKGILAEAGSRYTMHDPGTWPQQSGLAAAGKWDELKVLQDELDGGKVAAPNDSGAKEEE